MKGSRKQAKWAKEIKGKYIAFLKERIAVVEGNDELNERLKQEELTRLSQQLEAARAIDDANFWIEQGKDRNRGSLSRAIQRYPHGTPARFWAANKGQFDG